MSSIFCCDSIQPYGNAVLNHEPKFTAFMNWARSSPSSIQNASPDNNTEASITAPYAIQLVRQVNYGPLESKCYFIPVVEGEGQSFGEITESDLVQANFQKLNSYKNFKCTEHNKFFEVNVHQKDPVNKHHWRANIARPASEIDI